MKVLPCSVPASGHQVRMDLASLQTYGNGGVFGKSPQMSSFTKIHRTHIHV
jgi:hypothetical protein